MITEHDDVVAGARIHRREAGNGEPPIVLLHGLGWDGAVWGDVLEPFAALRRTIAFDLPGHGRSAAGPGPYSPAWLAGGVRAAMDAAGCARAVLVGNSLGGLVAASFAAAWPDRVAALILVAPALPNDDPPADRKQAARFLAGSLPVVGPALAARAHRRPAEAIVAERIAGSFADPARAPEWLRAHAEDDVARRAASRARTLALARATRGIAWSMTGRRETTWRVLRSIRVPTLILWGEQDRRVPVTIAERALEAVPGAHLVRLPDIGHIPQAEDPDAFVAAVTAFLRATDAAAATR